MLLHYFNDFLSFSLEITLLIVISFVGFHVDNSVFYQLLFGLGSPIILVFFWGKWMAPKANHRLPFPWVQLIAFLLFLISACLLTITPYKNWARPFVLIASLNVGIKLYLSEQFKRKKTN